MIFLIDLSVLKPDVGLIVWTIFIFALFWGLMAKLAFRPIINALKKRESDIQNSLDQAKRVREEMAKMKAENEELLAQAREERAKILKEAKEAGDRIVAEAKDKAKEEAKKIVTNAKEQIENQKMAAIVELKNQVGKISLEIAEKVIRKQLEGDKQQQAFVEELVKDLKLN
ncbi:MAG: ATP synthase F0 subunit B [Bacteroidetes bacterium]|nr:MAG: ATP synthase F0 subunit B [Bacteroidota bacterium]